MFVCEWDCQPEEVVGVLGVLDAEGGWASIRID